TSVALIAISACSSKTTPPPTTQADAQRTLCADLRTSVPASGIMPESLLRRLEKDADLFERAGDRTTAAGLRDMATTERAANAAGRDKTALAVFLRDGVSTSQRQAIERALSEAPGVVSVVY